MLHSVRAKKDLVSGVNISKDRFDDLLDSFHNFDHIETVATNPKAKKIALTFDDGFEDIYSVIYPCLKERSVPFTVFVTYSLLDSPNYLTKDQLIELSQDPLVTIGSHCVHHIPLAKASKEDQQKELLASHEALEALLQKKILYLAYPYGQYNDDTLSILKESQAYTHAFLACGSFLTAHRLRHPYTLPRMNISNKHFNDNMRLLRSRFK
jgi:peptidoglycan/xylan/chitin deacetylase (PgdA/CDA1 family)